MFKFINKIVGKLTLPNEFYVDSVGDLWTYDHWNLMNADNPYHYQSLVQNEWGKWVKGDMFLGKNTPLLKVKVGDN